MSDEVISFVKKAVQTLGHSRYLMQVHGCDETLDVLKFQAEEALSETWCYDVIVTCENADIACEALLMKPASFTFQVPMFTGAPATPVRTVFGVVQTFRRISTSKDEARYALTLVPRLAMLGHTHRSEIYLNQSVPEVVEQVLRSHGFDPMGPAAGNFLFVDVGTDADDLNDALLRRGVIVRPMGSFGAPSALRITAGTPEEIAFLGEQLASVFAKT